MLNSKKTKKQYSSSKHQPVTKQTVKTSFNASQIQPTDFGFQSAFFLPKSKNNSDTKKVKPSSRQPRSSICSVDFKKSKIENPERRLNTTKKYPKKTKVQPFDQSNKQNYNQTNVIYNRFCQQRCQIMRNKRLRNDLIQNSLELFSLCQTNLEKRQKILVKLKQQLNLCWKKLCQMLSQSKTGDPEIVQTAIKNLIDQRKLIEEERRKINEIMEMMKI